MSLHICLEDALNYGLVQCLYVIHVDRMDALTFLRMSAILQEHLEEPIRHSCVDLRLNDVHQRLLSMFANVEIYPATTYRVIAEMKIKRLVMYRVINGKMVITRPSIEGDSRLSELYP